MKRYENMKLPITGFYIVLIGLIYLTLLESQMSLCPIYWACDLCNDNFSDLPPPLHPVKGQSAQSLQK